MLEDILAQISKSIRFTPWPGVMSRETAAAYCDLSPSGFDAWVREGRLPKPIAGTKRWSKDAIDRHVSAYDGTRSPSEIDEVDQFEWLLRSNGYDC